MFRWAAPYLAYLYLSLVKWTTRLEILGEEKRALLRSKNQRFIYAFWHNQQMFFTTSHRGDNLSVLVSLSRDGEMIAKVMSLSKIRASRGSSSKNASAALKEMMRLTEEGWDLGITPDGPKGPKEEVKRGGVFLAQKLGVPILPTANFLSRKIVLRRSWDQYQVPLPCGRAAIAYGKPIWVGPDDDLDLKAKELAKELSAASLEAQDRVQSSVAGFRVQGVLFLENLLFAPLALFFLLKFLFSSRRRILLGFKDEIKERLGFVKFGRERDSLAHPLIWVHASSAGEVSSVEPLIRLIKAEYPRFLIAMTSTNAQGKIRAQKLNLADFPLMAPLDFFPAVRRFLNRARPKALILVETELWPHLIALPFSRKIPVILASAALSERSFWRYQKLSFFVRPFLKRIALVAAQTDEDAERFKKLGVDPAKVFVSGSLKYDRRIEPGHSAQEVFQTLNWGNARFWVAASTHLKEEEILIEAFLQVRQKGGDLKLVIAPRHVERARELEELLQKKGVSFISYSKIGNEISQGRDCLVLDRLGILAGFYRGAVLTFVGGTLIPLGGHSLIEPALEKSPVAFGPSVNSSAELARVLVSKGAGFEVRDVESLASCLNLLAENSERLSQAREAAQFSAQGFRGASARTLEALKKRRLTPFL